MSRPIPNVYALLNVAVNADANTIAQAIAQARQQQRLSDTVLNQAEQWLLHAAVRAQYDAKLKQAQPELFHTQAPTSLSLALEEEPVSAKSETRLGLLAQAPQTQAPELRIDTITQAQDMRYWQSQRRYNQANKLLITALVCLAVLVVGSVVLYPLLKSRVFSPSQSDQAKFRQELVDKGWQEDVAKKVVFLKAHQSNTRLEIVYENHQYLPVLNHTDCAMNQQGLCDIQVRIDNELLPHVEQVGVGLRDTIPLASRSKRAALLENLQDARRIDVSYFQGSALVTQTFTPN